MTEPYSFRVPVCAMCPEADGWQQGENEHVHGLLSETETRGMHHLFVKCVYTPTIDLELHGLRVDMASQHKVEGRRLYGRSEQDSGSNCFSKDI